jgi:hypothetical protein
MTVVLPLPDKPETNTTWSGGSRFSHQPRLEARCGGGPRARMR